VGAAALAPCLELPQGAACRAAANICGVTPWRRAVCVEGGGLGRQLTAVLLVWAASSCAVWPAQLQLAKYAYTGCARILVYYVRNVHTRVPCMLAGQVYVGCWQDILDRSLCSMRPHPPGPYCVDCAVLHGFLGSLCSGRQDCQARVP